MKDEQKTKEKILLDLNNLKNKFLDYHKRYIQRNIRYKLLMMVEKNREKVEEFRKKWQIPEEGFKTGKQCRKWWQNLPPEIKNRSRIIFYFEEEQIFHIKNMSEYFISSTPSEHDKRRKVLGGRNIRHLFIYEIEELMADCQIDPFWYYPIEHYLLYNEINMNFMLNPGFAISVKTIKGENDKVLSNNISVLFSANTRLRDIKSFAFPLIKYYQTQLTEYKDESDNISKNDEEDNMLGPKYFPKQTVNTWLVSSGFVRSDCEQVPTKSKKKK